MKSLFNTHCIGITRVIQSILPSMGKSNDATIINISSRLGSVTNTVKGRFIKLKTSYSYRIAKASQNMLTLCLHQELHKKIIVLGIHPGEIKTSLGSKDAKLPVEDAAKKVLYFIDNIKKSDSGKFFNTDHKEISW